MKGSVLGMEYFTFFTVLFRLFFPAAISFASNLFPSSYNPASSRQAHNYLLPRTDPFKGNRTFNQWLSRNDIDSKTGRNMDAIQGFQGRFWRWLIVRRICPTRGNSEERQSNQAHAAHTSFSETFLDEYQFPSTPFMDTLLSDPVEIRASPARL